MQKELELEWCLRISRRMAFEEEYPFDTIKRIAKSCKVIALLEAPLDLCLKHNSSLFKLRTAYGGVIISVQLNMNSSNSEIVERVRVHELDTARSALDAATRTIDTIRADAARQTAIQLETANENIAVVRAEANAHLASFASELYNIGKTDTPSACWKLGELLVGLGETTKGNRYKKVATLLTCGEVCVKKGLPAPPWTQYTIGKFL
jgi:hypothetical protein